MSYLNTSPSMHLLAGKAIDIGLDTKQFPAYTNYIKVELDKYFVDIKEEGSYHLNLK